MPINVLMCGGRRAGKTSVLAGIQKNMMQSFTDGSIVLDMKNTGRLVTFRNETEAIFSYDYEDEETFLADQRSPDMGQNDYMCDVHMMNHPTRYNLCFTDVPGEWFIDKDPQRVQELYRKLRDAHVLVIAVDSPHLMEEDGEYHQVFNRADRITGHIKECFQGNNEPRMVIFVPVKSERYRATPMHPQSRMPELLAQVKAGYADLIGWLTTGGNKDLYTVVVAPCFTFGGAEFLQFVPPIDEETGQIELDGRGIPLEPVGVMDDGEQVMQYLSEYRLLRDSAGMHYYKPQNCEQPLLYILLYLIAMSRTKGVLGTIWRFVRGWANNADLQACAQMLKPKLNHEPGEGFEIINDPLQLV